MMRTHRAHLLRFLAVALLTASGAALAAPDPDAAYSHLETVMDQFHEGLDVYTDAGAGGNHFTVLAVMGSRYDILELDPECTDEPGRVGEHCFSATFTPIGTCWAGLYFMNGVLLCGNDEPGSNWGEHPGGVDLVGATQLSFRVRGEHGGERVEFFMGGIGRDPYTGTPTETNPDSALRTPAMGSVYTLSSEWDEITIDLTGLDLSAVLGGFGFAISSSENADGAEFYLDEIRYDKPRLEEPRFLQSYRGTGPDHWLDDPIRQTAFVYDNAVALLAFLLRDTTDSARRAGLIAEALVYAQDHDRLYDDGRLRTAYASGDIAVPSGWAPNCRVGTSRLPGWTGTDGQWYEDHRQVGTATGPAAWAVLALAAYAEHLEELGQSTEASVYVDAAKELGGWLELHCRDTRGAGGYTGGYLGPDDAPVTIETKSTEENLSLYAAFMRLYGLTGETSWRDAAEHARAFVDAMWHEAGGLYWSGTVEDGITPNYEVLALDANAWPLLALGDDARQRRALDWVLSNLGVGVMVGEQTLEGFDFNTDQDGAWWGGTAQVALALHLAGESTLTEHYLGQLGECQATHPAGDADGLVAASPHNISTGFEDWLIPERLHVGATGWLVMAASGRNPFWASDQIFSDVPPSHWAFGEIGACVAAGIVQGYGDGTYRPDTEVTRDQMAVYIARGIAGGDAYVPEGPVEASFPDVSADDWAFDHIEYAAMQGVVQGYPDGEYKPSVEVTRDQMAVYVARAMEAPSGEAALADYVPSDPRDFADVPSTGYGDDGSEPFWAYRHIEYCVEHGVVQGYEDGLYHPEWVVTRDQMAVYMARAFSLPL